MNNEVDGRFEQKNYHHNYSRSDNHCQRIYCLYFRLYDATQMMKEYFENRFSEWTIDADVLLDLNNLEHFIEWSITRSNDMPALDDTH